MTKMISVELKQKIIAMSSSTPGLGLEAKFDGLDLGLKGPGLGLGLESCIDIFSITVKIVQYNKLILDEIIN